MSTRLSTLELRRLTLEELRRETAAKRLDCAKMRMGIELGKEKNHALYRRMRRDVARMAGVLTEMSKTSPKDQPKSTESASKVAATHVKDAGSPKKSTIKKTSKKLGQAA